MVRESSREVEMLMPQNSRATVLAGLVFLIGGCASVPERGAVELATLLEGTFKTPANSSDDPMTVRQVRFVAAGLPLSLIHISEPTRPY